MPWLVAQKTRAMRPNEPSNPDAERTARKRRRRGVRVEREVRRWIIAWPDNIHAAVSGDEQPMKPQTLNDPWADLSHQSGVLRNVRERDAVASLGRPYALNQLAEACPEIKARISCLSF